MSKFVRRAWVWILYWTMGFGIFGQIDRPWIRAEAAPTAPTR